MTQFQISLIANCILWVLMVLAVTALGKSERAKRKLEIAFQEKSAALDELEARYQAILKKQEEVIRQQKKLYADVVDLQNIIAMRQHNNPVKP